MSDGCQELLRLLSDQRARQMKNVPSCVRTPAATSATLSCPTYRCTAESTPVSGSVGWWKSLYSAGSKVGEFKIARGARNDLSGQGQRESVRWVCSALSSGQSLFWMRKILNLVKKSTEQRWQQVDHPPPSLPVVGHHSSGLWIVFPFPPSPHPHLGASKLAPNLSCCSLLFSFLWKRVPDI